MIIFADHNKELCNKVNALRLKNVLVINDDVFKIKNLIPASRIVTASNPIFSAGGGLDAQLVKRFPDEWLGVCPGLLTNNLLFVVSVGGDFKATPMLVSEALKIVEQQGHYHTLILTGLGTGIGGLGQGTFIKLLKKELGASE